MKILAFDLDGTAIRSSQTLSERLIKAFKAAAELGVELIPATGRMYSFLPPDIQALPMVRYVITSNGAAIYDKEINEEIYSRPLANAKAMEIAQYFETVPVYYEVYYLGHAYSVIGAPELLAQQLGFPEDKIKYLLKEYRYVEHLPKFLSDTGIHPEKINLPHVEEAVANTIKLKLDEIGGIRLASSIKQNLEINDINADKGFALNFMANKLGAARSEVMAIGDGGNDIGMLGFAGVSVAMGNAQDSVKSVAKHVTDHFENDGLARAIEALILHKENSIALFQ